jgi:autotransporter-associated beta strand protein
MRKLPLAPIILVAAGVVTAVCPRPASAQSGSWSQATAGTYTWSTSGNWTGGTIADGPNNTATFATASLTGPINVNLDTSRNIGGLVFDNPTNTFGWTISGTNTLTLATSPTIAVNNANITATLSTLLASTQGFNKTGAGTLTVSNNNTGLTGPISLTAGTLVVNPTTAGSPIGTAPITLAGGTLSFRNFGNPIAVTGFNNDVITAVSEYAGGTPFGTTRAVDGTNGSGSFVYYEQGVNTAAATTGAPTGGRFQGANNVAVTYQLAPYTSSNVLSMGAPTAGSAATTLTLTTPASFNSINIMNVTGNGPSTYSFTLNFSDSSSTTVTGITSRDWFGGPASETILQLNGRLNRNDGTFANVNSGDPRIYSTDFTLSAADQLKTLNSITFATTSTGGTFNVFGLSGSIGFATQVYTNPVTVTADSTLDQLNVPNVTLGPLSIGTNKLTTTGSAGSNLTLGAATLTGNPEFSPQTNSTLILGALTGGATARTITKSGGGTLTLGTAAASLASGSIFNATAGTTNLNVTGVLGNVTTYNASGGTTNITATGALGSLTAYNATGGTTNLNAIGALGAATALTLSPGATVNLGAGANQTVASLAGTAGTLNLGANTNTFTIGGGGASTYGGGINGGTVVVTGTGTSQTINGITSNTAYTVQNGGRLAAGAGYLLRGGGVTMTGTSTLSLGLGSTTASTTINGFTPGGTGTDWNLLGNNVANPTITNNVLTITTAVGSIANAAWLINPVTVGPFAASYRYSQTAGTTGADGITFTLQNSPSGNLAIGDGGGGLGYTTNVTNSVAVAIEIFSGSPPGYKYGTNANLPGGYSSVSPVVLTNAGAGNEITFNVISDGLNISATLTQGANTFNLRSFSANLATLIGGTSAFVGFTGGTGGSSALQNIDNFSFTSSPDGSVYSAPITLSDGSVSTVAVNFNSLRPTATVPSLTVGNGSSLTVQADTGTAANAAYGLTVSGTTSLSGGTNTITVNNNGTGTGTLTLNGVVSGSTALNKAGAGTLVMKGANTYTGNTSINAGTLTLTGSGSFAGSPMVFVATGATLNGSGVTGGANFDGTRFALANAQTLQGNGTVVGPLGISAGSTISPGTTPAKLTINGGLTFTGGTYSVVINGPTVSQYDQIAVAGNVALGTGVATLATPSPSGTGYTATTVLAIILNTGSGTTTTGNFSGLTNGNRVPAMDGLGGFNWNIYYNGIAATGALTGGNDVLMAAVPVPEPVTVIGFAAAGLGLIRFVRRRR